MKKHSYLLIVILSVFIHSNRAISQNVVFIMADDLGIGDVSCYGATMIETPSIDKLASQGVQFERYYTTGSVCTPTRYSILSGISPIRCEEIATDNWKGTLLIDRKKTTLASVFKQKGYKTAAIGKWHLGYGKGEKPDYGGVLKPGPLELGFDYHWGLARNHNDNIRAYVENHMLFGLDPTTPYNRPNERGEKVQGLLHEREDDKVNALLTERVINFIKHNQDHPFFVYFTPTIAHTHITPLSKFRGTSNSGQYGDFVQELDFYVGKIMELLEELNLAENTIVVFTSDNGGQLNDHRTAGLGLNLADTSMNVALKSKSAKTDAREMGHKTNLDWREGKGSPYEGGFRVPLIIRWPSVVKAGESSDRLITAEDFLATFGDLLDVKIPEGSGVDSYSFSDEIIKKRVAQPRTNAVLHAKRARSFVDGNWKLVDFSYSIQNPKEKFELYNLAEDPAEAVDLAAKNPEKVTIMREMLSDISGRHLDKQ